MNPLSTRPYRWRPITVFNLLLGLLFSLTALAQPAFLKEGLVAYYPFNGNANDESGNGNDGTYSGLYGSDRNGNPSSALDLDGNNIVVAKNPVQDQITEPTIAPREVTYSAWVFYKPGEPKMFLGSWGGNAGSGPNIRYDTYGGPSTIAINMPRSSVIVPFTNSIGLPRFNEWVHIGMTWKASAYLKIYINGNLTKTSVDGGTGSPGWNGDGNSPDTMNIGGHQPRGAITGSVDDVRIYNRALSDTEVQALYAYESTPPNNNFITNGLVAYYPFNGNANDESGNANNGIASGAYLNVDRFGNKNQSFSFNGGTDLITVDSSNKLNHQSNPFSISVWVKNKGAVNKYVIAKYLRPEPDSFGIATDSPGTIYGFVGSKPLPYVSVTAPSGGGINEWQFISYIVTPAELRLYVNGLLASKRQITPATYSINNTHPLTIGGLTPGSEFGTHSFIGDIDDVRIYNRALSETEVKALYDYESATQQINPRIATATAQVVNGFVVGAIITDTGNGYVSNPVVSIIGGGGTGAQATATQLNGVVTSITITNPGIGYTSAPTITIAPPPFPPRKATSTAQVVNGFVVGTKITDGGFGYDSPPAVLFVGGGGSGATAVATVASGVVTAITITNPGIGYTSAPLVRIASPPFTPKLAIETSKVYVRMSVVLGRKYQLEASTDLNTWTTTGPAFIAQDEELAQEFDVNQVGKYFRINQVP